MGLHGKKSKLELHPQRQKIIKDLIDPRVTDKQVAVKWGLGLASIQKYKTQVKHLMHLAKENLTESTRDALIADVQEIHNEAKEFVQAAKGTKNLSGAAALITATLATIRLKGEIHGVLGQQANGMQAQPQGVNISMLIGLPRNPGVPLREGGDEEIGPTIEIQEEKEAENFYS